MIFDEADQPPITASTARFILLPSNRPRPIGMLAVKAAARRWVALLALMVYSLLSRSSSCGPPLVSHPIQPLAPDELLSVARASV